MNNTNNSFDGNIFDYVSIVEITFNLLLLLYTNYKLGHIIIKINEIYCFDKRCCGGCFFEIESDSNSH